MIPRKLRYLAFVPALLVAAAACGGRSVTRTGAEKILVNLPSGILDSGDVDVVSVSQTSSSTAVVETRVKAAFRVEKVKGDWVVREVRVGNGQWESLDNLLSALNRIKAEETRRLLESVAASIGRYREKNGRLPTFGDYSALSDALYPDFQSEPLRFDAWRQPLRAFREGAGTVTLVSAGPDGKPGTSDDIILKKTYAP